MNTSDKLQEIFSEEYGSFLDDIQLETLQSLGVNLSFPIWFYHMKFDSQRNRDVVIHDDNFVMPVASYFYQPSRKGNWRKFFFKKHVHNFKILGIKTCMLGGEVQGIYYKRNEKIISRVGFDWLFKKEQDILTIVINRAIGTSKPGKHITPLNYTCVADREFHLFLCGKNWSIERDVILDSIEVRTPLFNSTKDNKLDDRLNWVGRIDMHALNSVYDELTQ